MAGNLGLFGLQSSNLLLLKECTLSRIAHVSPELVIRTGLEVATAVARFKATSPELVPTVPGGLLGPSVVPVNDFLIAEKLFDDRDLVAALMVGRKMAGPRLLSYIATVIFRRDDLSPEWVESAWRYVVHKIMSTSSAYENYAAGIEEKIKLLEPFAQHGQKFKGRKPGSIGLLARAIRKHLKKFPDDKPKKVWQALERNPPKGLRFCDTRGVGKYVEYVGKTAAYDTDYHQFQNRVAEQKKFLRGA